MLLPLITFFSLNLYGKNEKLMANKIQSPESKNCFLKPTSHQYNIKRTWIIIKKGTAKLKTDNRGKDFGEI